MQKLLFLVFTFYVLLEAALFSSIIDVYSPDFNISSFQSIRDTSGYMGGFGFGLIASHLLILRGRIGSRITRKNVAAVGGVLAASLLIVGWLQTFIVDRLVDRTDVGQRKAAIVLAGATYGLMSEVYKVNRLGLSTDTRGSVESRTAIVLFSPFVIWGNALSNLEIGISRIVQNTLFQKGKELRPAFDQAIGKTCSTFNASYEKYRKLSGDIRRKLAPTRFDRAYREKRDAYAGYSASLPLGLTKSEFVQHPDFQAYVRYEIFTAVAAFPFSSQISALVSKEEIVNGLNHLFARKLLDPCMTWDTFQREYIGGVIKRVDAILRGDVEQGGAAALADGERLEELGRGAILAAIGPPLAFGWFLMVVTVGMLRIGYYICREVLLLHRWFALLLIMASLGAALAGPFLTSNRIIDSPAFRERAEAMEARIGTVPFLAFQWMLRATPIVYPVGAVLRDYGPAYLVMGRR